MTSDALPDSPFMVASGNYVAGTNRLIPSGGTVVFSLEVVRVGDHLRERSFRSEGHSIPWTCDEP